MPLIYDGKSKRLLSLEQVLEEIKNKIEASQELLDVIVKQPQLVFDLSSLISLME